MFHTQSAISGVEAPPIAEAMTWLDPAAPPEQLINLCQAVPSYAPAESLRAEVARAARLEATSLYTPILGIEPLRDALAAHMSADYRARITPAETAITAGCNQAFCVALMALAGRGDNVVMPSPWYFNHDMWLRMLGVEARAFPAYSGQAAFPDPDAAAGLIDRNTRAIVLCSPNNPTGAIYPPEIVEAFFSLCQRRGIALILDETYKDFRPDPAPPHGLFGKPDWQGTLIQLYSFSKVFALTGYRAGSVVAGGAFLAEIEKIMDCVAICAPHIGQVAALYGLNALDSWKREKSAMMQDRVAALRQAFAAADQPYELLSSGAYFAYVRHPFSGIDAKTVAQGLAREQQLLCLPGTMFGPGQERRLRLAFANIGAERMEDAVGRLGASAQRLSR
jgi:aspartate/methionine/tyrosine aminotransferase